MSQTALTLSSRLLTHLSALTGLSPEDIDPQQSLLLQGIDSIGLMRTVNLLRKQGIACSFETLKEQPTLRDWLALLSQPSSSVARPQPAIPEIDLTQPVALTPVQQAYWMGRQDDQPLGGNACQIYLELQGGNISPQRLQHACERLTERHPMLRARFTAQGEQYVSATAGVFRISTHDLRHLPEADIAQQLDQYRQRFSHNRADVAVDWPLRIALSRLPDEQNRLHFNLDLLVADVLSVTLLLRDLAHFYQHENPQLAPLPLNFFQYQQLKMHESHTRRQQAQRYWHQRLSDMPGCPSLPLARQPEQLNQARFSRRDYLLKTHQLMALEAKARRYGVTLATLFLTLYCEILARWSETPHFLINVPLFNRDEHLPRVSDMVADFTSLLLLEVDFREPGNFTQRLQQLQRQLHRDIAQADYSGIDLLRDMARQQDNHRRTAPVVFALNLGERFVPHEAESAFGKLHWMISQTPQVWIDHQSYPTSDGLLLNWDSVDALFPEGMVSAMFSAWLSRLHQLIEQDWDALTDISLPVGMLAARQRVNATACSVTPARLHDAFFDQATRQPHAPAILTADSSMSYETLAQRAMQIGYALRERGVRPGEVVAISLPKGTEQVAAVLGILAAGAIWLPLSVAHPLARRALICQRAGAVCVITHDQEAWPQPLQTYRPGGETHALATPYRAGDDQLAYIIYTSGSTGDPKGVAITHHAAWNTISILNQRFAIGSSDRVLALSGLEFDLSVYDIFGLLSAGGAIVMPQETERRDPDSWQALSHQYGVTLWNSVPALMEMLLLSSSDPLLPQLRMAWLSGDRIAPDLAQRLRERLSQPVDVIAMGGATEAAIWSNAFSITPDVSSYAPVPYGYPLANQCFRVMDGQGRDCPDWVPGELWIGGEGLAQGYVGDELQTAQRFVEHQGQRWYRTGDCGCYQPDGLLHFLGRLDHQVKVDGHRIELAEIETALQRLPGVTAALCLVNRQRLEGVVTGQSPLHGETLLSELAKVLPDYMLPKRLLVIDALPLTPNGKVDRAALVNELNAEPAPAVASFADENPLQFRLRQLWQTLLASPVSDLNLTFFQAGGNSLQAMRLVQQINQTMGIQLSLRQFLSHASIAALADFIETTFPAVNHTEEGAL